MQENDNMKMALSDLYEDITGLQTQTHTPEYRSLILAAAPFAVFGSYPQQTGVNGGGGMQELKRFGAGAYGALMAPYSTSIGPMLYQVLMSRTSASAKERKDILNDTSASERENILKNVTKIIKKTIQANPTKLLGNNNNDSCEKISTVGKIELHPENLLKSMDLLLGGGLQLSREKFVETQMGLVKLVTRMRGDNAAVAFLLGRPSGKFSYWAVGILTILLATLIVYYASLKKEGQNTRNQNQENQQQLDRMSCAISFLSDVLHTFTTRTEEVISSIQTNATAIQGRVRGLDATLENLQAYVELHLKSVGNQLKSVGNSTSANSEKIEQLEKQLAETMEKLARGLEEQFANHAGEIENQRQMIEEQKRELQELRTDMRERKLKALNEQTFHKTEAAAHRRVEQRVREMQGRVSDIEGHIMPTHPTTTGKCNVSNIVTQVGLMIGDDKKENEKSMEKMRTNIERLCLDMPSQDYRDFVSELLQNYTTKNAYIGRNWPAQAAAAVLQHAKNMKKDAIGGQKLYLLQKGAQTPFGGHEKIFKDWLTKDWLDIIDDQTSHVEKAKSDRSEQNQRQGSTSQRQDSMSPIQGSTSQRQGSMSQRQGSATAPAGPMQSSSSEQQEWQTPSTPSAKFGAYQKLLIIEKSRELSAPEIAFMQTYKEEHKQDAERAQKKVSEPNPALTRLKTKIEQEALQEKLNTQREALERERKKLAERTQKREQNRSTPVVSASSLESLE